MIKVAFIGPYAIIVSSLSLVLSLSLTKIVTDDASLTTAAYFSYIGILIGVVLGAPKLLAPKNSSASKIGLYVASGGILSGLAALILFGTATFAFVATKFVLMVVLIGFNLMAFGAIFEHRDIDS